jgi:hypothetical protein
MKPYRVSVRFYADRKNERRTIDYLKQLPEKTINRFIVDAVIEKLQDGDCSLSAGDLTAIREIVRDELGGVTFAAPSEKKMPDITELTEEENAANQESVLADMDAFFS